MPRIILIFGIASSWLTFSLLIPATSAAVTISLVPDRPPTIGIGETVHVEVFIVLDAADQAVGISAVTMHIEKGRAFVDVTGSGLGSPFPIVGNRHDADP